MNVTLRQLRAFVAVARTGSFTLAAERLFLTQSALSGQIKELEQALGLRLFDRSTRRLNLSEVGQGLYPRVDKILHDLDDALAKVDDLKALKGGAVSVAAPQLLASTLLPEVIAAYSRAYPQVRVKLTDCVVEGVIPRVFSGEVDIGVGPERDANSAITATQLFEIPFMAVFPPGHALEKRRTLRWSDLEGYPVIALQGQFTERLMGDVYGGARIQGLQPANEVAFMSTALSMVNEGLGITICMPYAAAQVRLYGLVMRPLTQPVVRRKFYVYTRTGHTLSPAAQSFLDFLLQSQRV
jgi:DNA-binding transcriptional LysR family regulator